jgi:ribosomal protein S15P/S13E
MEIEIFYNYLPSSRTYEVKDFEATLKSYEEWLENNIHSTSIVTDEDTYRALYKQRTKLRKEIENLKKDKKSIENIILGSFQQQIRKIVDMLGEKDDEMSETLAGFKPKPQTYEISFKTKNIEHFKKVKNLIEKLEREEKNGKI